MPDTKDLERFVQGGGDVSTIPDAVWSGAGLDPALKAKIATFQAGKGDMSTVTLTPTSTRQIVNKFAAPFGPPPSRPSDDAVADDPRYNTKLTPQEESAFAAWKAQHAPNDSGYDYDLRGAFKAGLAPDPATGHWADTFKKPNHETFSDESQYRNEFAGHWNGDAFVPASPRSPVERQNTPVTTVRGIRPAGPTAPVDTWNPNSDRPLAPAREPGMLSKMASDNRELLERQFQNTMAFANPQHGYDAQTDPGLVDILSSPNWDKGFISYDKKGNAGLAPGPEMAKTYLVRRFMDLAQGMGLATAPVIGGVQTALEETSGILTGGPARLVPLGEQVEPGTGLVPRLGNLTAQGLGAATGFTLPEPIAQTARDFGADRETSEAIGLAGAMVLGHGVAKVGGELASKVKLPEGVSNKLYGVKATKPQPIPHVEITKFNEVGESGKAPSRITETADRDTPSTPETLSAGFEKADQPTTKKGKPVTGFENAKGGSLYKMEKQADGSYAFKPEAEASASINSSTPQPIPRISLSEPSGFVVSEPGQTQQLGKRAKGGKRKPSATFSAVEEPITSPTDAASGVRKPRSPLTASGSTRVDSDLPHELKAVRDGQAPAWFLPNLEEGTIPTKGEAWFRKQTGDKVAEALGPDVRILQTKEGTVIFNPQLVTTEQLKTLEAEGRTTDIVNGNRTSPKPENPTTAVVARDPQGVEVRTVLTDSPEKTAEVVSYQQSQGLTTEVIPVEGEKATAVLTERTKPSTPITPRSGVKAPQGMDRSSGTRTPQTRIFEGQGDDAPSKGIFKPRRKPVEGPKTSEPTQTTSDTGSSPISDSRATSGALAGRIVQDLFSEDREALAEMVKKAREEGISPAEAVLETARSRGAKHPDLALLEETLKAESEAVDRPTGGPVKDINVQDTRQENSGVIGGARAETGMTGKDTKTRGTSGGRKSAEVEAKAEARRQTVLNTIADLYKDQPEVTKVVEALRSRSEGATTVGRKLQPVILQQSWAKLKEAMPDLTLEDVAHAFTGNRRVTAALMKLTGEKPVAKFRSKSTRSQKGTISFGGGNLTDGAAALIGDIITKGTDAYEATSKWVHEQAHTVFRTSDGGVTRASDILNDLKVLRDKDGTPKKWFHGSKDAPFETLDPAKLGANTGARSAKRAFFFTEDPANAVSSYYVGSRNDSVFTDPNAHVRVAYVKAENPLFYDMKGQDYSGAQADGGLGKIIDRAKVRGHDAVIFQNFLDPGPRPVDVLALINPEGEITASHYPLKGKAVDYNALRSDLHDVDPVKPRVKLHTREVEPSKIVEYSNTDTIYKAFHARGLSPIVEEWPARYRKAVMDALHTRDEAYDVYHQARESKGVTSLLDPEVNALSEKMERAYDHALETYYREASRYARDFDSRPKAKLSSSGSGGSVTLGSGLGGMQPLLEKAGRGATAAGRAIFEGTLHEMSKVNEQGKILAQKMKQAIHEASVNYHTEATTLGEAWSALSSAEKDMVNALPRQGRQDYSHMSPVAQAYGRAWHDSVDRQEKVRYPLGNYIQGQGGPRRSNIPARDFQPLMFEPDYVKRMKAGDPATLAEFHRLNPGVKTNPFIPAFNPKTGAVIDITRRTVDSVELSRKFKYPEKELLKNVHEGHLLWLEDMTKANAEHKNFRYNNPDGTPRNGGIGDKADFLHSLPLNERKAWERTIDSIEGNGLKNMTEKQKAFDTGTRAANLYTTFSKIGGNIGSGIKQVTSALNVATIADYPTLARGLVDMMVNPMAARRRATAKGAAPFTHEFPEYFGSGLGDRAGHAAKTTVRLSGAFLGFMDGMTRTVAHEAAPHALKLFTERLQKGGKEGEYATRTLDDMLFKPSEVAEIASGKISPATELKFKNEFVSYTQQSARMPDRPRWTHEGAGKLVSHLKQFGLAQTRFDMKNVMKEATVHGNLAPLGKRLAGAIALGETLNVALSPFRKEDENRKEWRKMGSAKDVIYRITQDLADASFLGLLGDTSVRLIQQTVTGKVPYKGDAITNNFMPAIVESVTNGVNTGIKMADNPDAKHVWGLLEREFSAARQTGNVKEFAKDFDYQAVNDFLFAKPQSRKPSLNLRPR